MYNSISTAYLQKTEVFCFRTLILLGLLFHSFIISAKEGTSHSKFNFDNVEIKSTHLNNNIYMLTGRGGNIGLCVGDDGVFMIDDEFAPLSNKVIKAVQSISKKPIRFLINTHWHDDHTGGNENFSHLDTLIIAHDNVRKRLKKGQFLKVFKKTIPPYPQDALPVVTFDQNITFHFNNEEIKVFHFPDAHTDGDSLVLFKKANVLHTGDIFFNGIYPFIDKSSNGSVSGIIAAIDHIKTIINESTKIIPGHGPEGNLSDLIEYQNMLKIVQSRIFIAINKGQSLDEVVSQKPLHDLNIKWGGGFLNEEHFTEIIYNLLNR